MSEVICKRLSLAFQLFKHAFDGIPIPVDDLLESERVAMAGRLQPGGVIEQEDCVVEEMFLAEFRE